ncbi:conserved membrane protein of unknown function (plasmid) [Rhodovastum atsumiense]|uniref:Uncharacterized protein n=1 Tax=Rhodovastum atsumiense TaxID=504468 RepID=A0A5M6IN04_9PROT|nr:phage holin family protein [Rhodovastum atsumiense]KAA5609640.1 hypothetical protein F1189_23035 [Rhodovastum atsumiense]CAH2606506.1 conserved membrane protein of unknown function [Rhodovastum atsumiense]
MDDQTWRDIAHTAATAGGLGLLGRLLALAAHRRPLGWSLLWEVPTAIGMGWIGQGLGEWLGLLGFPRFALIISISYVGPRLIDAAVVAVQARIAGRVL